MHWQSNHGNRDFFGKKNPKGKKETRAVTKQRTNKDALQFTLKGILSIHPQEYGFIYRQLRMQMINDHSIDTTREGFSCRAITKWTNQFLL